jgi:mono/diheme cytochrome c family protein
MSKSMRRNRWPSSSPIFRMTSRLKALAWTHRSARLAAGVAAIVMSSTSLACAQAPDQGAEVYRQSGCIVCHGGLGTGGFGPKLAGDPMLAIGQFAIARILIGGGLGSAPMPAFGDKLSNEQIAAVVQYMRTNWGNDFGPVTPDQVADTRNVMNRALQVSARAAKPQQ